MKMFVAEKYNFLVYKSLGHLAQTVIIMKAYIKGGNFILSSQYY